MSGEQCLIVKLKKSFFFSLKGVMFREKKQKLKLQID